MHVKNGVGEVKSIKPFRSINQFDRWKTIVARTLNMYYMYEIYMDYRVSQF